MAICPRRSSLGDLSKMSSSPLKSSKTNGIILDGHEFRLLLIVQASPVIHEQFGIKTSITTTLGDISKHNHDNDLSLKDLSFRDKYLVYHLKQQFIQMNSRLSEFITEQLKNVATVELKNDTLLNKYLSSYQFTELHLDAVLFLNSPFPKEIFRCNSVRWLSLKYNNLFELPAGVGQMSNLECLILTDNKLQNKSIPYTITFCTKLRILKLNNNLLDALPGFLLEMKSLETVHRHGNHNYFKSTFMWYHTDVHGRILPLPPQSQAPTRSNPWQPHTLQFCATQAVVASKTDYFTDCRIGPLIKDYITEQYDKFNVCGSCNTAKSFHQHGYKVITFKNPYLGNTCVPFQHWSCSHECAMKLEVPAREEQIAAAREQDRRYDDYTKHCQNLYMAERNKLVGRTQSTATTANKKKKKNRPHFFPSSLWCHKRSVNISSSLSSSSSMLRRPSPECTPSLWSSSATSLEVSGRYDGPSSGCRATLLCCTACRF